MMENQPSRTPASSDMLGLKPGEIFWNNYRVLSVIGKGGVSTVYKAENLQTKQYVAIKLLHAQKTRDEELVRRFIREAQTTTKLEHPHAIHIYEWGIDQSERPFMIIEYLAGETLAKRIQKSNGLNYNKAVEVMDQVCAAIQEAHSMGIIHRDLKPDNIMLTTHQGVEDWVKVCDFGIAKLEPEFGEETGSVAQATLTHTGAILGTPMYMSPEQLRGRKADARSDIYSLGCIMYEMLTGKPPFASKNTAEIVVGHLNQVPEMPHRVRMDLNIPEKLSEAAIRALAKNPWERPTTVQEFITSLRKSVEKPNKMARPVLREMVMPSGPTVNTPTPYGMVVHPVKRVCPHCKTVASGGNFKFCLKCGQDNMGKWLPYHDIDKAREGNPLKTLAAPENRRIVLWVILGIILCFSGNAYLSKPLVLTGKFVGKFDHPLFEDKTLPPALARSLKLAKLEMLVSEDGDHIHGLAKTTFGEDDISGKIMPTSPMILSYDLYTRIEEPTGKLELLIDGTYDKLARSYDWTVKALFNGRNMKPIADSVKMTVSPVKD
jgi:serine/threonine protein kinase